MLVDTGGTNQPSHVFGLDSSASIPAGKTIPDSD